MMPFFARNMQTWQPFIFILTQFYSRTLDVPCTCLSEQGHCLCSRSPSHHWPPYKALWLHALHGKDTFSGWTAQQHRGLSIVNYVFLCRISHQLQICGSGGWCEIRMPFLLNTTQRAVAPGSEANLWVHSRNCWTVKYPIKFCCGFRWF